MKLLHRDGSEVLTGDIVWEEDQSYIFLQHDGVRVEVKTTDDRRMFLWISPHKLNLRFESEASG